MQLPHITHEENIKKETKNTDTP